MVPVLLALGVACGGRGFADPTREFGEPITSEPVFGQVIASPTTLGVADTQLVDIHGTPVGVGCATCHGPTPERAWTATPGEAFHTGVTLDHGTNTCDHCHSADRTALRLADGSTVEFGGSIALCAQCHGPQWRDYRHGAHGGMAGYWDLRRGPRTRNHCAVCHAPHAPQIPQVTPVLPPADRYLETHP